MNNNDLSTRLANLPDKKLIEILSDKSKMYSEEAINFAKEIAHLRGLFSNFADEEFKVITAGGRENEHLDVTDIKGLFLKKLINEESLLFVESQGRWLPLREVFNVTSWSHTDTAKESNETREITSPNVELTKPISVNSPEASANQRYETKVENPVVLKAVERQPASVFQSNSIFSEDKENELLSHYEGISGWLAFFIFSLFVLCPFVVYMTHLQLQDAPVSVYNFFVYSTIVEVIVGLIIALLLVSRHSEAPKITKIYLVLVLIANILLPFVTASVIDDPIKFRAEQMIVPIGISTLITIVWLIYFFVSKRVKATYQY